MDGPNLLLKYAVEEILQKINKESLDPQAAVTKVAEERKLNPNFIKRASEVINVALTYNHFKKHAAAKDEDFPIVDAQKVVADIFDKKEKTASQLKSEWFPSGPQDLPNLNLLLTEPKFAAAYESILKSSAPTESEISERGVYEKSALYIDRLEKAVDEQKIKLSSLQDNYTGLFAGIAAKYAKDEAYRTSFSEFESQAYAIHGETGVGYTDFIYKSAQMSEPRGILDSKYTAFTPCDEVKMLGEFIKASDDFAQAKHELVSIEAQYKEAKQKTYATYHAYGKAKHGSVPTFNDSLDFSAIEELAKEAMAPTKKEIVIDDPVLDKIKAKIKGKARTEIVAEAEEALDSGVEKKSFDFVNDIVSKYKSPEQKGVIETDEDTQGRQLMLENLAHTDPILSQIHPKKLIDSYSQLLRLAPELSKEKEVVRATLRQMSASQALGPFEAQQLVEANTKLLKQKMLSAGQDVKA